MKVITKIGTGRAIHIRATVASDNGGDTVAVNVGDKVLHIPRDSITYIAPFFSADDPVEFNGKSATVLYPHGNDVVIKFDDGSTATVSFTKLRKV